MRRRGRVGATAWAAAAAAAAPGAMAGAPAAAASWSGHLFASDVLLGQVVRLDCSKGAGRCTWASGTGGIIATGLAEPGRLAATTGGLVGGRLLVGEREAVLELEPWCPNKECGCTAYVVVNMRTLGLKDVLSIAICKDTLWVSFEHGLLRCRSCTPFADCTHKCEQVFGSNQPGQLSTEAKKPYVDCSDPENSADVVISDSGNDRLLWLSGSCTAPCRAKLQRSSKGPRSTVASVAAGCQQGYLTVEESGTGNVLIGSRHLKTKSWLWADGLDRAGQLLIAERRVIAALDSYAVVYDCNCTMPCAPTMLFAPSSTLGGTAWLPQPPQSGLPAPCIPNNTCIDPNKIGTPQKEVDGSKLPNECACAELCRGFMAYQWWQNMILRTCYCLEWDGKTKTMAQAVADAEEPASSAFGTCRVCTEVNHDRDYPGVTLPPTQATPRTGFPSAAPTGYPSWSPAPPTDSPTGRPQPPSLPPTAAPTAAPSGAPSVTPQATLPPRRTEPPVPSALSPPPPPPPPPPPSGAPSWLPPTAAPSRGPSASPSEATSPPTLSPSVGPAGPQLSGEVIQPHKEEAEGIMQGATVAAALAGPAPGMASLLLLAEDTCGSMEGMVPLGVLLHPLRFSVAGSQEAGCVVGNICICAFLVMLQFGLHRILAPVLAKRGTDAAAIEAVARVPGGYFVLLLTLYQGATLSCTRLFTGGGTNTVLRYAVGGVGVLALAAGMPAAAWRVVLVHVQSKLRYVEDPRRGPWRDFLLGRGEWCSPCGLFHQRYGGVVSQYKPPHAVAAVYAQLAECAALSLLAGWNKHGRGDCGSFSVLYGAVILAHGIWVFRHQVYSRPRDTVYEFATTLCCCSAMGARAVGYWVPEDLGGQLFAVSSRILIGAMGVLAVKLALDMSCFAYVVYTGRRHTLQKMLLAEGELTEHDLRLPKAPSGPDLQEPATTQPLQGPMEGSMAELAVALRKDAARHRRESSVGDPAPEPGPIGSPLLPLRGQEAAGCPAECADPEPARSLRTSCSGSEHSSPLDGTVNNSQPLPLLSFTKAPVQPPPAQQPDSRRHALRNGGEAPAPGSPRRLRAPHHRGPGGGGGGGAADTGARSRRPLLAPPTRAASVAFGNPDGHAFRLSTTASEATMRKHVPGPDRSARSCRAADSAGALLLESPAMHGAEPGWSRSAPAASQDLVGIHTLSANTGRKRSVLTAASSSHDLGDTGVQALL
eukprot:TRINITY_DN1302_c0_g1_i4.p1 TRINITY_DN1302_c0_g1~~TRINITY_DN1302_c0_g1_i4.p1  ORF type:complete len:1214 (+),score=245.75 TRINITY_DN1302_c0_g1_i4:96-3737(+)